MQEVLDSKERSEKFRRLCTFLSRIDELINIFDLYPSIMFYLDGCMLSVDQNWRRRGIASKLMAKWIDVAKEKGADLVKVVASSEWTSALCLKMGFKVIVERRFSEIKIDGQAVLVPEPHKSERVFIKEM